MVIKDPRNRELLQIIGGVIWFVAALAAIILGFLSDDETAAVAVIVSGTGILAFASAILTSLLLRTKPVLESVLLALSMVLSVDSAGYMLGYFSEHGFLQDINSSSASFVLAVLLALVVIGATVFGVALLSRTAAATSDQNNQQ